MDWPKYIWYMDLENLHVIGCGKEGSLDVGVSIQALRVAGRNYRTKCQAAMSIFTLTFPMWTPLMVREREREITTLQPASKSDHD